MNFQLDRIACVFVTVALFTACRGEEIGTTEDSGSTSSASTSGADSTGPNIPTTSDTNGTSTTTVDPDTTTPQTDTTDNTNAFITMNGTTDDTKLPNGEQCTSDDDCESMHCYTTPIAPGMGVCSECETDQDCVDAGTGISCSADLLSMQAACAPGEEGNQCMSQEACMDPLICAPVIDTGGLLPFDTCGECGESSDCDNGQLCSPVLDMGSFSGSNQCVDPGSVPNGSLCPEDMNDGDAACTSGHCGTIDVMGFIQIPVCGECEDDVDCAMGQTCTPGMLDLQGGGITGATCT